ERLGVLALAGGLAPTLLLGVAAPDDRIVGAVGAGHVQRIDLRVLGEVSADLRAAVADGEPAAVDERLERALEVGADVPVDRVHLADDDLVLGEELVEEVHRRDRRDIAGAEDERDLSGPALRLAVDPPLARRLALLEPNLGGEAAEHDLVLGVGGEDAGDLVS